MSTPIETRVLDGLALANQIRGVLAQERASRDLQIEHLSKENPFKDT